MAAKFVLTTPYGNRYLIHENGDIERTDIPSFQPSGSWKMLALVSAVPNRREFIAFSRLSDFLNTAPELRFKNGKPRYTVRDLDHGTTREWGNTAVHGVAHIREL